MKKLFIAMAVACVPFTGFAENNADCPVGADVVDPIRLEEVQAASFGMIPSERNGRVIFLDFDGKVYSGPKMEDNKLVGGTEVTAIGASQGRYKVSYTPEHNVKIKSDWFSGDCNGGTKLQFALIFRDKNGTIVQEGDPILESNIFNIGAFMPIKGGFVGNISCTYNITASYM